MTPLGESTADMQPLLEGFDGGSLVGKRYVDDEMGLEVLCTKPGPGSLSVGQATLVMKSAKSLPSSD